MATEIKENIQPERNHIELIEGQRPEKPRYTANVEWTPDKPPGGKPLSKPPKRPLQRR